MMRRGFGWMVCFFLLLLVGEVGARLYFFLRNQDPFYLTVPFAGKRRKVQPAVPYKVGASFVMKDPCFGREITVTVNRQGSRGKEWVLPKPPGTFRIMILGASSTFGADSPDWATWPVLLEEGLQRRYGPKVEVLSASWPGVRIAYLLYWYSQEVYRYEPDLLIYYEGWNDAPMEPANELEANVLRLNQYSRFGPLLSRFYYRSMLYTYLFEKTQVILAERLTQGIVPRIGYFQLEVKRFLDLARKRQSIPVLVLQVNDSTVDPTVRNLRLTDRRAVRNWILQGAGRDARAGFAGSEKLRMYQAQALVEAVRRIGEASGVQVVDPRPALERAAKRAPFFCGPIHLTDRGNQILAQAVAEQIQLPIPPLSRSASLEGDAP